MTPDVKDRPAPGRAFGSLPADRPGGQPPPSAAAPAKRPAAVARWFLACLALAFAFAALVHGGWLVTGYEHGPATVAESVIAAVLLASLGLTWAMPAWARAIGLAALAFALLGTLVGVFAIIRGIGPQTGPDIVYHAVMVLVLIAGLVTLARTE